MGIGIPILDVQMPVKDIDLPAIGHSGTYGKPIACSIFITFISRRIDHSSFGIFNFIRLSGYNPFNGSGMHGLYGSDTGLTDQIDSIMEFSARACSVISVPSENILFPAIVVFRNGSSFEWVDFIVEQIVAGAKARVLMALSDRASASAPAEQAASARGVMADAPGTIARTITGGTTYAGIHPALVVGTD